MTQEEATRVIDRLVADLARATGQPDPVIRLGYGLGPALDAPPGGERAA